MLPFMQVSGIATTVLLIKGLRAFTSQGSNKSAENYLDLFCKKLLT